MIFIMWGGRRRELSPARLSISTASEIVLDLDTPDQESPDESLYDAYDEYEKYDEYSRYDKYDKCDKYDKYEKKNKYDKYDRYHKYDK